MDSSNIERKSHTPVPLSPLQSSASSDSSPSSSPGVLTWSAAIVQLGYLAAVIVALPFVLHGMMDRDSPPEVRTLAWRTLAGMGATFIAVASPTSFRALLTVVRSRLGGK